MVDIAILKLLSSFFVFFFPRSSAKQTLETLKFVHDMSLVSSVLFLTKGGVEIGIYQIHYQRGRRLRILNIFYDSIVNLSLESLDVFFFPHGFRVTFYHFYRGIAMARTSWKSTLCHVQKLACWLHLMTLMIFHVDFSCQTAVLPRCPSSILTVTPSRPVGL